MLELSDVFYGPVEERGGVNSESLGYRPYMVTTKPVTIWVEIMRDITRSRPLVKDS
jgi:hypothetical protein